VVECKSRTLEDMIRTMLITSGLPRNFWAEAPDTSCYIINRCMIRSIFNKAPYELFKGRKPNIIHLRVFGCKCYVHNNGKDILGKFDPRSDEVIFWGYYSHSKAYKVFNKRTLCVEESVHVLFDENNSLGENDAHDAEFELGLIRRDLLLTQNSMHKKGKSPRGEPSPGADNVEDGQGLNQSGGSIAKPISEQNQPTQPNSPRTDLRIGSRTGLETGSKPVTPSIPARVESVFVDPLTPRPSKHQSSHPLDQILSNMHTGVQTRSKLKIFVLSMLFSLTLSQKVFLKLMQNLTELLQRKRSYISLKGTKCGTLYHSQRTYQSSALSACSETSCMSSE